MQDVPSSDAWDWLVGHCEDHRQAAEGSVRPWSCEPGGRASAVPNIGHL